MMYTVSHFTRDEYAVYYEGSVLCRVGTRDYCVAYAAALNAGADTAQTEAIAAPYKAFNVHSPNGLDVEAFDALHKRSAEIARHIKKSKARQTRKDGKLHPYHREHEHPETCEYCRTELEATR